VWGATSKEALTVMAPFMVTVHVPVPEHPPPDQPEKVEPDDGVAVSVTTVPSSKGAEQVEPQAIPEGEEATAPEPLPCFPILSVYLTGPVPPSHPASLAISHQNA